MIILVVLLLCELTVAYFTFSYLNVVLFVWGDGVYVCGFGFASDVSALSVIEHWLLLL